MISEQFFERVLEESGDVKRRRSLQRIREACDVLLGISGAHAVTIADVGRYCIGKWGGPKTQSIRNSPEILELYIRLRIAEQASNESHNRKEVRKGHLNLANHAIAEQQYALALAEVDELKKERARLLVDIANYAPISCDELLSSAMGGHVIPAQPNETRAGKDDELKLALRSLFDPTKMRDCELQLDPNGYLVNSVSGNYLLTPNEVKALRAFVDGDDGTVGEAPNRV